MSEKIVKSIINESKEPNYSLNNFPYDNVIIYGAGVTGKLVYKIFKYLNINVLFFLDRAATKNQTVFDLPVYHYNEQIITESDKSNAVVITLDKFKYNINDVVKELNNCGFDNAFYDRNIMCKSNFYHFNTTYNLEINLKNEEEKILKAFNLFDDENSKEVFISFLKAYATSNFDNTVISKGTLINTDVKLNKGYSKYIDCGAYIGDTFSELIKFIKPEIYVGIEPMIETFELLSKTIDNNPNSYDKAYLFPCGVADVNSYASFDADLNGGSGLSENGKSTIITSKIDSLLKNISPTIIKMDVEGAEIPALKGAKETILKFQPDLAICVYHRLSDLWNIPLLIKNFDPNYKLSLRCYGIATLETILFATI
ncbi:MAG: FkbM family methyltransferase [Acetobacterium woodii]|nr:FkbM family methyltransferase [Acetobacterium woodii]